MKSLGGGAFGQVYLAEHKRSGMNVAVKKIEKERIKRAFKKSTEGFQELKVLREVNNAGCPNVLELIETYENKNIFILVTYLAPGGDLLNYIKHHSGVFPMTEQRTAQLIRKVALALRALHRRNIIHRDLKLCNILMSSKTEDAEPILADFGSAFKIRHPNQTSSFRIGTPGYIPPEMLEGRPYNFSIDVWSLGCLMHTLLTGQMPFWDENEEIYERRVCNEPLDLEGNQLLRKLSNDAKDLLRCLMEKDVSKRATIEQVVTHKWLRPR